MSDYREVQHGFEILNKFFSDQPKLQAFVKALDICVPGAATEAIQLFNGWWDSIRLNTYIMSISQHDATEDLHGRLSMWRAFGGHSARVAFVVKIPWFSGAAISLNLLFSPVAYLTEIEAHNVFQDVISNIGSDAEFLRTVPHENVVGTIFYMLLAGVTCLKHEGFREELEWRAIYCPKFRPSPLMECSTEIVGGVPQEVYRMPLDIDVSPAIAELDLPKIFDRLIIGPSPYPWVMYEAFSEALIKIGIADARNRVFVSGIPIRS